MKIDHYSVLVDMGIYRLHFLSMPAVLLQNKADPSIRNTDGKTPYSLAEPLAKLVLTGEYKKEELLEAAR